MFRVLALMLALAASALAGAQVPTAAEARAIARDAYIYGFPVVDNYRVQYAYFVDRKSKEFKAPWNRIANIPRVFTPEDKAAQTPNSDTPYSWIARDGTQSCGSTHL